MIDDAPIVAIVTGIDGKSRNAKTGALAQVWILRDGVAPLDAIKTGADASICGDCPHRGRIVDGSNRDRSCYVNVFQAPTWIYKCLQRGLYGVDAVSPSEARAKLAGLRVRLGAYGDPAALPFEVLEEALADAKGKTGYSHQWRTCDPRFARYVMASCDNDRDYLEAKARGYRTFRVRRAGDALNAREVVCPASKEAGVKTTCAACMACGGNDAKAKADIAIIAHGAASKVNAFIRNAA